VALTNEIEGLFTLTNEIEGVFTMTNEIEGVFMSLHWHFDTQNTTWPHQTVPYHPISDTDQ
jgi:hypothetical protein